MVADPARRDLPSARWSRSRSRARRAGLALGLAVAALLVAPMVYSFSVWLAPVDGTFPTAGPYNYAGHGGFGVGRHGAAATAR